jgi:hypothetical protein
MGAWNPESKSKKDPALATKRIERNKEKDHQIPKELGPVIGLAIRHRYGCSDKKLLEYGCRINEIVLLENAWAPSRDSGSYNVQQARSESLIAESAWGSPMQILLVTTKEKKKKKSLGPLVMLAVLEAVSQR